jgi:hypothetical protein
MTEDAQVRELFRHWQRRLRLEDWSLSLDTFLSQPGEEFEGEPDAETDIRVRGDLKEAVVYLTRDQPLEVLEWVLVRELLRLVLHDGATEEAAQQLTAALLDQTTVPYAVTWWFGGLKAGKRPEG